ncbi:MAG: hypothetical protein GXX83_08685 [Gaiellales bacterium]|nr:hypothetical protein [Gaiellales bacterium]
MDAGLIIMLVCIGIFLVLAISGLVVLGLRIRATYQAVSAFQQKLEHELGALQQKQQLARERVAALEANTQVIQERGRSLAENLDRVSFLFKEFAAARERIKSIRTLQF